MGQYRREHRSQGRTRRGSVYVLVLGASTMMVVVGLGVIAVSRAEIQKSVAERTALDCAVAAESGVEFVLAQINGDNAWRTTLTSGATCADFTLGPVRIVCRVTDEADGNLADDAGEPVRITAEATLRGSRRVLSALATPAGRRGLDVLRTALHANGNLNTVNATSGSGPVSSNGNVSNSGVLVADVEAGGSVSSSATIQGSVLENAPAKATPAPSAFSALAARATVISYSGLGDQFDKRLISASSNPYGSPNPEGIYSISVPLLKKFTIKVGSSRVDLQACKLEYSIVSPK